MDIGPSAVRLLLDLVYVLAALVASPWIVYRMAARGAWKGFGARLGLGRGEHPKGGIWLHAASVGEATLLRPLVERLEREFPGTPLVISTFTVTGRAAARKAYPRHSAILSPLDLSLVVARFFARLEPRLVVLVESDFWPNFIEAARRRGVPVAVVNGKISPRAHRAYTRLGVLPRLLAGVSLMGVQSEEHAQRFASLGLPRERLAVTGNMKYDLVPMRDACEERAALRQALGYRPEDMVVIGGSLHEGEDEALLEAFVQLRRKSAEGRPPALILVPRYPEDAGRLERHVRLRGGRPVRKRAVDVGEQPPPGAGGVLVVDTIGELGRLYAAADIAFVGGSLFYRGSNKGGHNLMEPAVLGVPVLFGPYNFSFQETVAALLERDAGLLVHDERELGRALERLAADRLLRRAMGERARRVVTQRQGAAERNCALLARLLRPGALASVPSTEHNAATS